MLLVTLIIQRRESMSAIKPLPSYYCLSEIYKLMTWFVIALVISFLLKIFRKSRIKTTISITSMLHKVVIFIYPYHYLHFYGTIIKVHAGENWYKDYRYIWVYLNNI